MRAVGSGTWCSCVHRGSAFIWFGLSFSCMLWREPSTPFLHFPYFFPPLILKSVSRTILFLPSFGRNGSASLSSCGCNGLAFHFSSSKLPPIIVTAVLFWQSAFCRFGPLSVPLLFFLYLYLSIFIIFLLFLWEYLSFPTVLLLLLSFLPFLLLSFRREALWVPKVCTPTAMIGWCERIWIDGRQATAGDHSG